MAGIAASSVAGDNDLWHNDVMVVTHCSTATMGGGPDYEGIIKNGSTTRCHNSGGKWTIIISFYGLVDFPKSDQNLRCTARSWIFIIG